ncbi:hypothetical protein V6N13_080789 [Hibiscus sabdariffa]|uniref:Uncharacterized protein n=2 Tax=Hibiscus sabdariffa TaxID=183260 RepID=A0ABR2CBQ2_9ROSI
MVQSSIALSCKNLTILNLDNNNLDGQVPKSFKNLKALTVFSLSRTNFMNLSSILNILQHCKIVLFPSENFQGKKILNDLDFRFGSLKILSIVYCELKGSISLWLLDCNRLQFLDLSRNRLSGTIPSWFNEFKYPTWICQIIKSQVRYRKG